MKAKDYIAKITPGTDSITATQLLMVEFMREAQAIAMGRSGAFKSPDRVVLPVVCEMDLKWRAVARGLNLDPNTWKVFWQSNGVTW